MSISDVLSVVALAISLWVAWQTFYYRTPKAKVRINSSGSGMTVNPDGTGEWLADYWDVTVSNIGKVPLVLTNLSLLRRIKVSVNDIRVGNAGQHVNLEDIPPTNIPMDEARTFRISANRGDHAPVDGDPSDGMLLSLSLMSSRGIGGLMMPIRELSQTVIVDNFRD